MTFSRGIAAKIREKYGIRGRVNRNASKERFRNSKRDSGAQRPINPLDTKAESDRSNGVASDFTPSASCIASSTTERALAGEGGVCTSPRKTCTSARSMSPVNMRKQQEMSSHQAGKHQTNAEEVTGVKKICADLTVPAQLPENCPSPVRRRRRGSLSSRDSSSTKPQTCSSSNFLTPLRQDGTIETRPRALITSEDDYGNNWLKQKRRHVWEERENTENARTIVEKEIISPSPCLERSNKFPFSGILLRKVPVHDGFAMTYEWMRSYVILEKREDGAALLWGRAEQHHVAGDTHMGRTSMMCGVESSGKCYDGAHIEEQHLPWGYAVRINPWCDTRNLAGGVKTERLKEIEIFSGTEMWYFGCATEEAEHWLRLLSFSLRGIPLNPCDVPEAPYVHVKLGNVSHVNKIGTLGRIYMTIKFDDQMVYSLAHSTSTPPGFYDFSNDPEVYFYRRRPLAWSPNRLIEINLWELHTKVCLGEITIPLYYAQRSMSESKLSPSLKLIRIGRKEADVEVGAVMDGIQVTVKDDLWYETLKEPRPGPDSIKNVGDIAVVGTPILRRMIDIILFCSPLRNALNYVIHWENRVLSMCIMIALCIWLLFFIEYFIPSVCFILSLVASFAGSHSGFTSRILRSSCFRPSNSKTYECPAYSIKIYENQRRIGYGAFSGTWLFRRSDPAPWTDHETLVETKPPQDDAWTVLLGEECDPNGFQYARGFTDSKWSKHMQSFRSYMLGMGSSKPHWVRRRCWVKKSENSVPSTRTSLCDSPPPSNPNSPRLTSRGVGMGAQGMDPNPINKFLHFEKYRTQVEDGIRYVENFLSMVETRLWLFTPSQGYFPFGHYCVSIGCLLLSVITLVVPFRYLLILGLLFMFRHGYQMGEQVRGQADVVIKEMSTNVQRQVTDDDVTSNWLLEFLNVNYNLTWDLRTLRSLKTVQNVARQVVSRADRFSTALYPTTPNLMTSFFAQIPSRFTKYSPTCVECDHPLPSIGDLLGNM